MASAWLRARLSPSQTCGFAGWLASLFLKFRKICGFSIFSKEEANMIKTLSLWCGSVVKEFLARSNGFEAYPLILANVRHEIKGYETEGVSRCFCSPRLEDRSFSILFCVILSKFKYKSAIFTRRHPLGRFLAMSLNGSGEWLVRQQNTRFLDSFLSREVHEPMKFVGNNPHQLKRSNDVNAWLSRFETSYQSWN